MMTDYPIEDRLRTMFQGGGLDPVLSRELPALLERRRQLSARRRRRTQLSMVVAAVVVLALAGSGVARWVAPKEVVTAGPGGTEGVDDHPVVVSVTIPDLELGLTLTASTTAPVLERVSQRLDRVSDLQAANGKPAVPTECYPDRAFYVEATKDAESIPFVGDPPNEEPETDRFLALAYPEGSTATAVPFGKIIARPGEAPVAVLVVRVHDSGAASVSVDLTTGESGNAPAQSGWGIVAFELRAQTDPSNWFHGIVRVLSHDGTELAREHLPHVSEAGDYC